MDNTLEPTEHASVVREYRAYERKQKKRQAHAIQSQNNKDRSKYYSYVKICKTYNEQNKLIEEAYFDVYEKPCLNQDSVAKTIMKYDERGNQIEMSFYIDDQYVMTVFPGWSKKAG